jgi:hypothetical protein
MGGWGPLDPALLPGSREPFSPVEKGGRQDWCLCTLQITAALSKRYSQPPRQTSPPNTNSHSASPPPRQTAQPPCRAIRSEGPHQRGGWPSTAPHPLRVQGPISGHKPTQGAYLNGSGRVAGRVASPETLGGAQPSLISLQPCRRKVQVIGLLSISLNAQCSWTLLAPRIGMSQTRVHAVPTCFHTGHPCRGHAPLLPLQLSQVGDIVTNL